MTDRRFVICRFDSIRNFSFPGTTKIYSTIIFKLVYLIDKIICREKELGLAWKERDEWWRCSLLIGFFLGRVQNGKQAS